ncbi:MAG: DUF2807 domain-containing protein [Ferruginibacter sp.]|nr:DUF2807 domain-containing protein [Ferruginibacter sp.]
MEMIQKFYQTINRVITSGLIFISVFLFFSFKPHKGNGILKVPVTRKEFKIENAFQSIRLEGDISVMLTNDPAGTVIIEGKEKELNKIIPVFDNKKLIIDVNRKHLFTKLTLYLSAITLQAIELNGDGTISSIDFIRSHHLHIFLNGTIRVRVKTMGQLSFDTPDDIELLRGSPFVKKKKEIPVLYQ